MPGPGAPFATPFARATSTYSAFRAGGLVRVASPATAVPPAAERIHASFRDLVMDPRFSCLGARSAIQRGQYRVALYPEMGSNAATETLAHDLFTFAREQETIGRDFATFIGSFTGPLDLSERGFEERLWSQLAALHDLDRHHHGWDPSVSSDPEAGTFGFSFAERAFFVVGLHPASSRQARRFGWPTLVFNPHEQFQRLRTEGRFTRMQRLIRRREMALQGSLNPNLSDFGVRSEAAQYSGRAVDDRWRCPFRPQPREDT